jgi:hypothetical protein
MARRSTKVLVSLLGLAVCGSASAVTASVASAGHGPQCRPSHAKTLLRSATIVVVRRRDGITQSCYIPRSTVRELDVRPSEPSREDQVSSLPLAVNDRYLAYQVAVTQSEGTYVQMRVLDARRNRVVSKAPAYLGAAVVALHIGPAPARRDVALRHDGAVAWIGRRVEPDPAKDLMVSRPRRRSLMVTSAPDIVSGSLALNARFVYWQQGDQSRVFRVG